MGLAMAIKGFCQSVEMREFSNEGHQAVKGRGKEVPIRASVNPNENASVLGREAKGTLSRPAVVTPGLVRCGVPRMKGSRLCAEASVNRRCVRAVFPRSSASISLHQEVS
jgi:hypothetical protein